MYIKIESHYVLSGVLDKNNKIKNKVKFKVFLLLIKEMTIFSNGFFLEKLLS